MARRRIDRPVAMDKFVHAIGKGSTREIAAKYANISVDTAAAWEVRYPDYAERVKEAEGQAAVGWLEVIDEAAPKSWQAAAWKLERKYPNDYGQRARIDVNVTLRQAAEQLAAELGLDVDEVLAETVAILAAAK